MSHEGEIPGLQSGAAAPPRPLELLNAARRRQKLRKLAVELAVLLAIGAIAVVVFLLFRTPQGNSALDRFWAPALLGSSPVSLCASFAPVWGLRDPTASQPTRREDFVPLTDQFVGSGDLAAISKLGSMLTRMKMACRVSLGNGVSSENLRAGPAILIGYSYSRSKEVSNQMRFFLDATHPPPGVTDNGAPTKWTLPGLPPDRHTKEDYAIVSRVFQPDTRAMLVEIAGITQYGTEAAADLVTDSDLLAEALRAAPPDWDRKNLQFVLHVKVISGAPASAELVASYFW
jgi:hypothetical protein